jgi:hypothetical protein
MRICSTNDPEHNSEWLEKYLKLIRNADQYYIKKNRENKKINEKNFIKLCISYSEERRRKKERENFRHELPKWKKKLYWKRYRKTREDR